MVSASRDTTILILFSLGLIIPGVTAYVHQREIHSMRQMILDVQEMMLYVDSDTGSRSGWTRVGSGPYLDAVDYASNYLSVKGKNKEVGDFGFADPGTSSGSIINASVQVYAVNSRPGDNIELHLWDGGAWSSLGTQEAPPTWGWVTWNATAQLNNWGKIDLAEVYLVWRPQAGSFDIYVDAARIRIFFTS
jgi:hypothetical protein